MIGRAILFVGICLGATIFNAIARSAEENDSIERFLGTKPHHHHHHKHHRKGHGNQQHHPYHHKRDYHHHKGRKRVRISGEEVRAFYPLSFDQNTYPLNTISVETSIRAERNRREKEVELNFKPQTNKATTDSTDMLSEKSTASPSTSSYDIECSTTSDCTNITNSICDAVESVCKCSGNLPVFVASIPECTRSAVLNSSCEYDAQCVKDEEYSQCDTAKRICVCIAGFEMKVYPDVGVNCVTKSSKTGGVNVDPAMIGVLAGLALMFVIICVVLRLFSKARFRENRSIFNTPNPRLMNASLFKDSKLLSPSRGDRRGSRASVRGPPSRAPSITSVYRDGVGRSPNGSLAKGRRGSTLSTASATGSTAGATAPASAQPSAKTPSPTVSEKKHPQTTVAIEAVD